MSEINLIAKKKTLQIISSVIPNNSIKQLRNMISLAQVLAPKKDKQFFKNVKKNLYEDSIYHQLYKRALVDSNSNFKRKFLDNFLINGAVINQSKRREAHQNGNAVPTVVLISPTMRCNLSCAGCYANNYSRKEDLDFDTVDRIIEEGKDMGVAFFTFLGGEPLVWSRIFDILEKHNDAFFFMFTNGTMLDDKVGKKIAELGNLYPILSLEGTEDETNQRRGKDTYKKVMAAMDVLKKNKIPFGYSVTVTRKNIYTVTEDDFFKMMFEKGALNGWYFIYMPIGADFDLSLMPTAEERVHLKERIQYIRSTMPLLVVDFWGDAPFVGGCIAGSKYIHINHKGDVEPCIFNHFSEVNIKNTTLKEAMNCNYFKEIRKRQPYSENLYLPCMLIDSPHVSRDLFNCCNIHSTDNNSERLLFEVKDEIDDYSKRVTAVYENIWAAEKEKFKKPVKE